MILIQVITIEFSRIIEKKKTIWWQRASWVGPASCRSSLGDSPVAPTACPTTLHHAPILIGLELFPVPGLRWEREVKKRFASFQNDRQGRRAATGIRNGRPCCTINERHMYQPLIHRQPFKSFLPESPASGFAASSFRRKPESSPARRGMDPGFRRGDGY